MQAAAVFTCMTQSWSWVPLVFITKGPFSVGREQSVWLLSSLPPQFVPKGLGLYPGCSVVRCHN